VHLQSAVPAAGSCPSLQAPDPAHVLVSSSSCTSSTCSERETGTMPSSGPCLCLCLGFKPMIRARPSTRSSRGSSALLSLTVWRLCLLGARGRQIVCCRLQLASAVRTPPSENYRVAAYLIFNFPWCWSSDLPFNFNLKIQTKPWSAHAGNWEKKDWEKDEQTRSARHFLYILYLCCCYTHLLNRRIRTPLHHPAP